MSLFSTRARPAHGSIRVGFFAHMPEIQGGATSSVIEMAERLHGTDRGVIPIVFAGAEGSLSARARAAGLEVEIAPVPLWLHFDGPFRSPRPERITRAKVALAAIRSALPQLRDSIEAAELDVVVSATASAPGAALACRRLGVPHIWWLKERVGAPGAMTRFVFGSVASQLLIRATASAIVGNARCVVEAYPLSGRRRMIVPGATLEPGTVLSVETRPERSLRLLVFGRVARVKEIEVAIDALAVARARSIDATLLVVGPARDASYLGELRQRIEDLGVAQHVRIDDRFADPVSTIDGADAVVACCRAEGFGRTALESLVRARPMVAVDAGGYRETVEHGRSGLLFSPGDSEALASHIVALAQDRDLLRRLTAGALLRSTAFSIEAHDEQWARLLQAVARGW